MYKGLDADQVGRVVIRKPVFYWTLGQVEQMLGRGKGWASRNGRVIGTPLRSKEDKMLLRLTDITPEKQQATLRVRHEDLISFLTMRRIPFSEE